jgi:type II secretory pathway component PulJ
MSQSPARSPSGYTLVEILVSTALSLILLGAVVRMFGDVGQGITDSRAMLEAADRLRLTEARLQQDLAGITVPMTPPRKPENNEGYFEYIEGPVGTTLPTAGTAMITPGTVAINTDYNNSADTTVGDTDDILMFTTRSTGQPFVGRCGAGVTIQSDVAEVAWFVRGRTLYRRVLLVAPSTGPWPTSAAPGFYANYDVSVSVQNGQLVANSLGDLTKRENRFAHQTGSFPFNPQALTEWPTLRLPTLCECSSPNWSAGGTLPTPSTISAFTLTNDGTVDSSNDNRFDAWRYPLPKKELDKATGAHSYFYNPAAPASGQRIADDVILTNVIGFDVKAWDPTYVDPNTGAVGAYVDLGYNNVDFASSYATSANGLGHLGHPQSGLNGTAATARVYDTYSFHYENVGTFAGDPNAGRATNGFDDNNNGIVDDIVYTGAPYTGENETAPPYPVTLRGIQVKIRIFEPDSRQVREVTVVQDFLPQ